MLNEFRNAYPTGSLISELLNIYQGKYLVRVLVIVDRVTLATGLAAEDTLEMAEDRARLRALSGINIHPKVPPISSDSVLSQQQSPGWAAREMESMARSRPQAIPPRRQDAIASRPENVTSDRLRDYSPSEIPNSADQWLSSPSGDHPHPDPPDPQEAIGSWSTQAKSFESWETDAAFSPVTDNLQSAGGTPASEPVTMSAVASQTTLAAQEIQTVDREDSPSENNFLDADERKTKIAETTIEIQRLNWTTQQGREFLQQRYNRRARSQLTDEQLLDFLHYLKAQPNPT